MQSRKSGFTLVETLIASAILVVGFTAVLQGLIYARHYADNIKCQTVADSFAWQFLWTYFNDDWNNLKGLDINSFQTGRLHNTQWLREQIPELAKHGEVVLMYSIDPKQARKTPEGEKLVRISVEQIMWQSQGKWKTLVSWPDYMSSNSPYTIYRGSPSRSLTEDK